MTGLFRQPARNIATLILKTGFIAGTLDILAALSSYYISTGKNPVNVLRFITSGLLGKAAFTGGAVMALLGLLLHFLIAFIFTIFFFWLYPKLKLVAVNRFVTAVVYGILVWVIMNGIVLPLSNTPPLAFQWPEAIKGALILIVMVGMPLSQMAYRYYYSDEKKE